ncbi:C4-dicarboxylate transporter, DcuC family [Desulfuromusa kysingii]|uniref:C4-dicarboxylate transporter, DcuC family n=1 Tax=Desulfuromusa kysingii TaxID=37625 RepID=A0A1H3X487_9BACT|nr:C4-dicarboxylate transporter DcuC [Desulfuromusa kysingii]SDZ94207.1 C4-dicarboxylate transporter, DcuC family [Desulfuromusa kysingii]
MSTIVGLIIIIGAIVLLVKQYETRMVLICSGFLLALAAGNPLAAFDAFSSRMVTPVFIKSICSVMGFAIAMKITKCDQHLIHLLAGGLKKVRFALIPGAAIVTAMINTSLISAAGVSAAVGAIFIPLLISLGVHPVIAGASVLAGTMGSLLSPGLSGNAFVAKLADVKPIEIVSAHSIATIFAIITGAIVLAIVAHLKKEDKGYVPADDDFKVAENLKVNPAFAIVPLIPVLLLLFFNNDAVRLAIPWAKSIQVPHAMLFGAALGIALTRTSPSIAVKGFFDGMGKGYGDIVGIIIAAAVFVSGMNALGLVDEFNAMLAKSESIASISAALGPFFFAVMTGSGEAASLAFNEAVTPFAANYNMTIINMGSLVNIGAALGRTMSPIAGATIICASLAKANPLTIAKRNIPGMLAAVAVAYIFLSFIL